MVAISFRTNNCVSRDNVECMERTLCCHGLCTVHAGRQGIAFGLASFAAGLLELPRRGGGSIVELPAKYAACYYCGCSGMKSLSLAWVNEVEVGKYLDTLSTLLYLS